MALTKHKSNFTGKRHTPSWAPSVRAERNRRKALELRALGLPVAEIAKKLKVTPNTVREYLKRALQESKDSRVKLGDKLLHMELERLDLLTYVLHQKVQAGDVKAVDVVNRLISQRMQILEKHVFANGTSAAAAIARKDYEAMSAEDVVINYEQLSKLSSMPEEALDDETEIENDESSLRFEDGDDSETPSPDDLPEE